MKIKTITRIFLVAPLGIDRKDIEQNNLINAYSYNNCYDVQEDYMVYLLFKPNVYEVFNEFVEREYRRTDNIIRDYDYPGGYSVLEYKIDEKWHKDVDLIKKGLYSSTSPEFKELFPKKIRVGRGIIKKETESLQWRIFNKDIALRRYWEDRIGSYIPEEMDVWHGWEDDFETFKIEQILDEKHK